MKLTSLNKWLPPGANPGILAWIIVLSQQISQSIRNVLTLPKLSAGAGSPGDAVPGDSEVAEAASGYPRTISLNNVLQPGQELKNE